MGPDKGAFSHPLFLRDGHSLFKNKTANQLKEASVTFIKVVTPPNKAEEPQQEVVKEKAETPPACVLYDDDAPPEQVAV